LRSSLQFFLTMTNLLSPATCKAIAAVSGSSKDDVYAAFRAVGIDPVKVFMTSGPGWVNIPGGVGAHVIPQL
jgi:hypothetical protein